jgi:hypothetical protein
MWRGVSLGVLAVLVLGVAGSVDGATSLAITSRPVRGSAKLACGSSDVLAGLSKGTGTDVGAISVEVFVLIDGARTIFRIPAGTYDGRAGWSTNDALRARFRNRAAPDGPTGVAKTMLSVGRRLKLAAKSSGDAMPLAPTSAPADTVRVAYVVRNGPETSTHCTQFAADRCAYAPVDAGTGWQLRCREGIADPSCGARPECGNGVRELGEQCDGGPLCSSTCVQGMTSCCQGENQCLAAPAFSLLGYLYMYCGALPPPDPRAGALCSDTGECVDVTIDPVPTCCQTTPTTCTQGEASSIVALWQSFYHCLQGSGDFSRSRFNAICSPAGTCISQ